MVELLDAESRRLTVARFETHNEVIGLRVEVKLPEPDKEQASVISVKKDGDAWRILVEDEIEKALTEWSRSIEEFERHMKKFAQEMLDQQKKKSTRKSKPQSRKR
jgi:hypothetical protein